MLQWRRWPTSSVATSYMSTQQKIQTSNQKRRKYLQHSGGISAGTLLLRLIYERISIIIIIISLLLLVLLLQVAIAVDASEMSFLRKCNSSFAKANHIYVYTYTCICVCIMSSHQHNWYLYKKRKHLDRHYTIVGLFKLIRNPINR